MFGLIRFFIKKTSFFVAADKFGNEYYVSKYNKDYLGRSKRFVLYKGRNEPSKVPAGWHAWLHYMVDKVPTETVKHVPNLTGTELAYFPVIHKLESTDPHHHWIPNKNKT